MNRNDLINAYAYLVPLTRQRCYPVPPARIAAEDLEGEGYLGLIRAADRYDPARSVAFKSWAITHIRGAMRELMRREDHLTRPHREALNAAGEDGPELVSLDELMTGERWEDEKRFIDRLPDPAPGPEEEVCGKWEASLIRGMCQWLPKRERKAIWLTDAEGMTNTQVAALMAVSEGRVSQLCLRGRKRLRCFFQRAGTAE